MTITAENLALTLENEVWLHPFSLTLEKGSFTTVVGPVQAGKTSLLRLLAGLSKPSGGKLSVNGEDVTGVGVRKRNVGMVYQEFVNYPGKTVFENIAAPLRNENAGSNEIKKRVGEVSEIVGISGLLDRYPLNLSGGQQQRLSIARTIARPRQLILLDEPLVNLDYKLREHLRGEFRRIFTESETIAVYASSEPREALILDGDTVVIHEGRILQHGRAADVYLNPLSTETARHISDPPVSVISARLEAQGRRRIWTAGGREIGLEPVGVGPLAEGGYQLGFHPHHLSVEFSGGGMDAVVEFVEVSGSSSFIYADFNGQPLSVKREGIHSHNAGETIAVKAEISRALVFDQAGRLVRAAQVQEAHHG